MKEKTLKSRVEYLEKLVRKIRNEEDSLDFSFEDPENTEEIEDVKRSADYEVDIDIVDDRVIFTTEHLEIELTQEDGYFFVLTMDSYGNEQPRPYTGKTITLNEALRKVVRAINNLEFEDDEEDDEDEEYESVKKSPRLKSRKNKFYIRRK